METEPDFIRKEWFKDHVAIFAPMMQAGIKRKTYFGDKVTILDWHNPDRGTIYATRYIFDGRVLVVHGDIGDAVYGWSERITPEFVASCEVTYFASKCVSDKEHRGRSWDSKRAERHIRDRIDGRAQELLEASCRESSASWEMLSEDGKNRFRLKAFPDYENFFDSHSSDHLYCMESWSSWIHNYQDNSQNQNKYPLFDSEDYDIGMGIDVHTWGHLIGVQMAVAQVTPKTEYGRWAKDHQAVQGLI